MSFGPANIIVLYAQGNSDSLKFAQGYQQLHSLADNQLVAVPCSNNEILSSYTEFQTEIETTVKSFISTSDLEVWGILVGYGVPGGFYDGADIIATTSRLSVCMSQLAGDWDNFSDESWESFSALDWEGMNSLLFSGYAKQVPNPLFNRQIYTPFSLSDTANCLICSRVDAPTIETAMAFLTTATKFKRQKKANGTFFFDPYTVITDSADNSYSQELLNFQTYLLPLLNLTVFSSTFWDEYTDVVIPRLKQDSFMWSWRSNRAGYSFFENTNTARIFLYNADSDDAGEMRNADDKRFPMLAISSGYVATAGAMSDPTTLGYLIPTPFFSALYQGATIGEAFMYACPFLNWTVSLIGDPLLSVTFPLGSVANTGISFAVGWEAMHDDLCSSLAYLQLKENDLFAAYNNANDNLTDFTERGTLISLMLSAYSTHFGSWRSQMTPLIKAFIQFSTGSSTVSYAFDNFLISSSLKCSRILGKVLGTYVASTSNEFPTGYWQIQTPIINTNTTIYLLYHFQLDVSLYADFSTILCSFSSGTNQSNWFYESQSGVFSPITSSGVPSSFAGRRVMYQSMPANYMAASTIYYTRIRQLDNMNNLSPYVISKSIIFT